MTRSAPIIDIPVEDIEFGGWSVDSPEAATEWEVESDREWSRGAFNAQRLLTLPSNGARFGTASDPASIKGRSLKQWYARGHSALNGAGDRLPHGAMGLLSGKADCPPRPAS